MRAEDFLARLAGVKRHGHGWMALCPGHDDRQASLSVTVADDGRLLLKCHANCPTPRIVEAAGLAMRDLFADDGERRSDGPGKVVAEYAYRDERGGLLFHVVRFEPKTFRQRAASGTWKMEGVRRVPYRLPEIVEAVRAGEPVFVVEGEKDADRLAAIGLAATTNPGGAGKWKYIADEARRALEGCRVVVLPDNDDPGRLHAADVVKSLEGAASSARVLTLPGLPPKGDVSDWIAAGGTRDELLRLALNAPTLEIGPAFKSAAERLRGEEQRRERLVERLLRYHVQFLDDALLGILPHDLILLGAESGAGKTALATMIAEAVALSGRRVDYFALEAEEDEIERRIKFRRSVQYLKENLGDADFKRVVTGMSYRGWYVGGLRRSLSIEAVQQIEGDMALQLAGLRTLYRGSGFTRTDLVNQLSREADLIVVDHLHYVDSDDDSENENRAQKRLIIALRDRALALGVPVIAVAHLRKKERHGAPLVPSLDDFHGSSDVAKNVTQSIVIAPAWDQQSGVPHLWRTYCAVRKDRMDGAKPFIGLLTYNAHQGQYTREYSVGRLVKNGEEWKPVDQDKLPSWTSLHCRPITQNGVDDGR